MDRGSSAFWQEVKGLFNQCLDLSVERRSQFLLDHDAADAVIEEVESMLAAAETGGVALSELLDNSVKQALDAGEHQVGEEISSFRLLKLLGRGGQGSVWLAQRSGADFDQVVAIKLPRAMLGEHERQRFLSELRFQARLSHPNVATLIDGGDTPDGRLYLVMEYVQGSSIVDHCSAAKLNLDQRLDLFLQVCSGVAHAHANLIVHRDLKPANILVSADGIAKVLDFGVAKSIRPDATETASPSALTLAYASPEQISGEVITTATDVYALGLLLFEILTGHRAQARNSSEPAQIIAEISSSTPSNPSLVSGAQGPNGDGQGIDRRLLQGDLDNIILMALRKEPGRRYVTVDAMAADLRRFRQGKPVLASGDSLGYRTKKLIGRNRVASGLALLVMALMVVVPLVLLNAAHSIAAQRDKAIASQQTAEIKAESARRIKEFLVSIFEAASPLGSEGKAVSVDEVLAQGERQLQFGLDDQPRIKGELLITMAEIQNAFGNHKKAIDFYVRSAAAFTGPGAEEHTIRALFGNAVSNHRLGDLQAAEQLMQQAKQIKIPAGPSNFNVWLLVSEAVVENFAKRRTRAAELLNTALTMLAEIPSPDQNLKGRIYSELGSAYKYSDPEKSIESFQLAVDAAVERFGKVHPKHVNRLTNLATALLRSYPDKAQSTLVEALEIAEQLYPPQHPELAHISSQQAAGLHDKGRFEQAREKYIHAMSIFEARYGKSYSRYAVLANNLASLYEDMGELSLALEWFKQSVALRRRYSAGGQLYIATAEANLARLLAAVGENDAAVLLLNKVMPIMAEAGGDNVLNTLTRVHIQVNQGQCADIGADFDFVRKEVGEAPDISWRRMRAELLLGKLALRCNRKTDAKALVNSALANSSVVYQKNSQGWSLFGAEANAVLAQIENAR